MEEYYEREKSIHSGFADNRHRDGQPDNQSRARALLASNAEFETTVTSYSRVRGSSATSTRGTREMFLSKRRVERQTEEFA
jgi:hypothetical protein